MKKIVLLTFLSVLLFSMLPVTHFAASVKAEPKTWTVDDNGPADFSKIKDAVKAASPGETILVKAGMYRESNIVLKNNLSLIGESKDNTIIDGGGLGKILILMTIYDVTISGFTIQNSSGGTAGIWVDSSTKNNISNNIIKNHEIGIYLIYSYDNLIEGNKVENNDEGIVLSTDCKENKIRGNNIANNSLLFGHIGAGVDLTRAHDNDVEKNDIVQNTWGILISYGNNSIFNNQIIKNDVGICEWFEGGPTYGYKIFHNNFINNAKQVDLSNSSVNAWDNGVEGNYWSDYNETDFNQDGIGDTSYVVNTNNTDYYPLMGMFHSFNTIPWLYANVISNSSIRDFKYFKSNSTIKMQVSNMTANQTFGFCRICIPHALMYEPYNVTIDGANPAFWNYTLYDNGTHRWIYFTYQHSTHEIVIQGSDTAPPIIPILSPKNKTYPLNEVPLTFTVDEPTDWMGYNLDGQTNVTITGNTTLTSLFDGLHYVVVYANDTAGNMGYSDTVYFTVDTVPPNIEILSPENKTYTTSSVSLNFTVNEATSWTGYSLDDQMNVSISGNTTIADLSDGVHTVIVFANDTVGNMGFSDMVHFTIQTSPIDTTPPSISIISPMDKTYATTDVPLTFTVDEPVSWMAYSLDNKANVTIAGNTTLSGLPEGTHSLIVYAKDTVGNTGASEIIYFSIKTQQAEPFPTWIVAAIVIIAVVGAALLVYFVKFKKTTKKVK